ncbi:MAG: succinate--CoA ligase subunit alpha [Anaerolineaceae bacterium]|nr:succinate--CoA ligase subunit alpha [Anaerolineaceae bacterium]
MSILIDQDTRVLVQGITGSVGSFQARIMLDYGTNIVAGVTPGKGGSRFEGIPVFNDVDKAVAETEPNAAICFVPAKFARDAALEIIQSSIPLLVLTTEGVPEKDMIEILAYARLKGTRVVGPDTPGIIAPGICKLGVHPAMMYKRGSVGLVSKSGALSYEVGRVMSAAGIGQTTVVGIGGGPIWGSRQAEIIQMFFADPETQAVVMLGEVGGRMELEAAEFIGKHPEKPVVAMIVGRSAPEGAQMGHAGAIIEGHEGTAQGKIEALRAAGVKVATKPKEIPQLLKETGIKA